MKAIIIAPLAVCEDERLTRIEIRVLLALLSFSRFGNSFSASRREIAARCECSPRVIKKTINSLCDKDWVTRVDHACRYLVTLPPPFNGYPAKEVN